MDRETIVYTYAMRIEHAKRLFIELNGFKMKNQETTVWFKTYYKKNFFNDYKLEFDGMRKYVNTLSFLEQVDVICNLNVIKPLIHEICTHTTESLIEYYCELQEKYEVTNSGAARYNDSFSLEELRECVSNDTILRGKKSLYGKWDVIYSAGKYLREGMDKKICKNILQNKSMEDVVNTNTYKFNFDKFIETEDYRYLYTESNWKTLFNEKLLTPKCSIRKPPCAYNEGPFFKIKFGDLPYDMFRKAKVNFTKLSLEERRDVIKNIFKDVVKFYD